MQDLGLEQGAHQHGAHTVTLRLVQSINWSPSQIKSLLRHTFKIFICSRWRTPEGDKEAILLPCLGRSDAVQCQEQQSGECVHRFGPLIFHGMPREGYLVQMC